MMFALAEDVLRYLLLFLQYEDQIFFMDCSSTYQHIKKGVRKVKLNWQRLSKCYEDEEHLAKLLSLIEDPGRQVEIIGPLRNCTSLQFPFSKLSKLKGLDLSLLTALFSINNQLTIETLEISSNFQISDQPNIELLVYWCVLGLLDNLTFKFYRQSESFTLPYFPKLRSLNVTGSENMHFSLPSLYIAHLQKLTLIQCSNIDVSCLDYIPDLTIRECCQVQGIASLKNNRRIEMSYLDVRDISESCHQSEEVILKLRGRELMRIDLAMWRKVKRLTLLDLTDNNQISFQSNLLPPSVRRCSLGGSFVESVDWKPFTYQLTELTLSDSYSILSLRGLGVETIPVLKLESLELLISLDGLGRGNKKVTVKDCNQIEDFSPLQSVDTVIVEDCEGFEDIRQVNQVRDLKISSLVNRLYLACLGENMECLSLRAEELTVSCYLSLSSIPHLTLMYPNHHILMGFFTVGGKFRNQSITIQYKREDEKDKFLKSLYPKFLAIDYHLTVHSGVIKLILKIP